MHELGIAFWCREGGTERYLMKRGKQVIVIGHTLEEDSVEAGPR